MKPQGRDWLGIALAAAGVVGAISLAGIFIVYLIDSIGDDNGSKPAATTGLGTRTGPTVAAGPTGGNNGATGSSKPGTSGKAGASGGVTASPGQNKIPDGQRYKTYTNKAGGYSILVPKGWKKNDRGKLVGFSSGSNFVVIGSRMGPAPTVASVNKNLAKNTNLRIIKKPRATTVGGNPVVVASVRNVTRREPFVQDQYWFGKNKKVAAVNLGTPSAVAKDNADDFRRIVASLHWL
jgi:hypothetical protein